MSAERHLGRALVFAIVIALYALAMKTLLPVPLLEPAVPPHDIVMPERDFDAGQQEYADAIAPQMTDTALEPIVPREAVGLAFATNFDALDPVCARKIAAYHERGPEVVDGVTPQDRLVAARRACQVVW